MLKVADRLDQLYGIIFRGSRFGFLTTDVDLDENILAFSVFPGGIVQRGGQFQESTEWIRSNMRTAYLALLVCK